MEDVDFLNDVLRTVGAKTAAEGAADLAAREAITAQLNADAPKRQALISQAKGLVFPLICEEVAKAQETLTTRLSYDLKSVTVTRLGKDVIGQIAYELAKTREHKARRVAMANANRPGILLFGLDINGEVFSQHWGLSVTGTAFASERFDLYRATPSHVRHFTQRAIVAYLGYATQFV